jgi:hypothetical protein
MTEPPEPQQLPATPTPEPQAQPPPPGPWLIYCFDKRYYQWSDEHPPCECHKRRYHHRH